MVLLLYSQWLVVSLALLFTTLKAVPIDNRLAGDPEVRCGQDSMIIALSTVNPFQGNIYVKGRFNDNNCKIVGNGETQAQMQLAYISNCGVRRHRQVAPLLGMTVDVTIVIMFHRMVLTKVDRAFNIQCFYMQGDKTVTANLEVSMISTLSITSMIRMPNCTYQVLQAVSTGPPARYAQIGDAVYHKWSCVGGDAEMFCITVHTCFVDDGQGQTLTLLDTNGCAQDRYLLQNLDYTSDTMAGRESHVFKFADKPTLFFSCQIRLAMKDGATCVRPRCPEPTVGKRSVDHQMNSFHSLNNANVDVSANALTILDIEESESEKHGPLFNKVSTESVWCLSQTTASVFACLLGTLSLLCLALMISIVVMKHRPKFCTKL